MVSYLLKELCILGCHVSNQDHQHQTKLTIFKQQSQLKRPFLVSI